MVKCDITKMVAQRARKRQWLSQALSPGQKGVQALELQCCP